MRAGHPAVLVILTACGTVCGCGRSIIDAEVDGASDELGDDAGETEGIEILDMPGEACPAGLGEVVECECGLADGCVLWDTEEHDCSVTCELEAPCPTVTCGYQSGYGGPSCEAELDEEALACVIEALEAGEPMAWAIEYSDIYVNANGGATRTFHRLDERRFVVHHWYEHAFHGMFDLEQDEWFRVVEVEPADLQTCLASGQVGCLYGLTELGVECTDASGWTCSG